MTDELSGTELLQATEELDWFFKRLKRAQKVNEAIRQIGNLQRATEESEARLEAAKKAEANFEAVIGEARAAADERLAAIAKEVEDAEATLAQRKSEAGDIRADADRVATERLADADKRAIEIVAKAEQKAEKIAADAARANAEVKAETDELVNTRDALFAETDRLRAALDKLKSEMAQLRARLA